MVFPEPVSPVSTVTGDPDSSMTRRSASRAPCAGSVSFWDESFLCITAASNRAFSAATAFSFSFSSGDDVVEDAPGRLGATSSVVSASVAMSFASTRGVSPADISATVSALASSSRLFTAARAFAKTAARGFRRACFFAASFVSSKSTKTTAFGASDRESSIAGPGGACRRAVLGAFFIALNLLRAALNRDSRSSARAICNSLVSPDAHVAVTAIFSPAGFGRSNRCGCLFESSSSSGPTPPDALSRRSARLSSFKALCSTFSFFSRSRSSLRASLARARSRRASSSSSSPAGRSFRCLSFAVPSLGALASRSDALSSSDRR